MPLFVKEIREKTEAQKEGWFRQFVFWPIRVGTHANGKALYAYLQTIERRQHQHKGAGFFGEVRLPGSTDCWPQPDSHDGDWA